MHVCSFLIHSCLKIIYTLLFNGELYLPGTRCLQEYFFTVQEWDRPRPGRRPDIFPQFSPMKTPLPPPLPADPPEEDEEKKEEEEENPDAEPEKKPDIGFSL